MRHGTDGEDVENYLFVFENRDVYSGYYIDPYYVNGYPQWEHLRYFYYMDDKYWDYLNEQCYWGRLSPRDLDGIINELAQVDFVREYFNDISDSQKEIQKGTPMESLAERIDLKDEL